MQNSGISAKIGNGTNPKFCISVPFLRNCGDLRDSELRAKHVRSRILTSVPENAMTRATEFCDQHSLMPLFTLLKWRGSKGCARKAEGFFGIVEPLQFAVRSTVAKQVARECQDVIDRSYRPGPTGICRVRFIEDLIDPSETRLAAPMAAS